MTNIKKSRAKIRDMDSPKKWLGSERLTLLIKQLFDEMGRARGAQAKIARRTAVEAATVNKLLHPRTNPNTNVEGETVERVLKTFRADDGRKLRRGFFYDSLPRGVEPNYRDYLVAPSDAPDPGDDEPYTDDDMIEELRPTPRELKAMERHLKRFNYPRVDAYFKRAIISSLRAGQRMNAIDAGVDRMGDMIAKEEDESRGADSVKPPPRNKQ